MVLRALKVLLACAWVFALAQSYFLVEYHSEQAPLSSTARITLETWDTEIPAIEFYQRVETFARENHVTIARVIPSFQHGQSVRNIHLMAGNPTHSDSSWPKENLADFGTSVTTQIRDWEALGSHTSVGHYFTFDGNDTRVFLDFLDELGAHTHWSPLSSVAPPQGWLTSIVVMALLSTCLAGALAVAETRTTAIHRLHGASFASALTSSVIRYLPIWAISGLVTTTSAVIWFVMRQGTIGLSDFLRFTALIQGGIITVTLLAHGIVVGMLWSLRIVNALKGELPANALRLTAYGLRISGAFIALGAVAVTIGQGTHIAAVNSDAQDFETLGERTSMTLGHAYTPEDELRASLIAGSWIAELDRQGRVLISAQDYDSILETTMLTVNERYIQEQAPHDAQGKPITDVDRSQLTVFIPSNMWDRRQKIADNLEEDAGMIDPVTEPVLVEIQDDQRFFTFAPPEPSEFDDTQTHLRDPIIIAVPSQRTVLTEDTYGAYASQGAVLFDSPAVVEDEVARNPDLARYTMYTTPIATQFASHLAEQRQELNRGMVLVLGSIAVVALTGFAAALIAARQNSQRVFVEHVHGHSVLKIHWWALLIEALLIAGVAIWIPISVARERLEFNALRADNLIPPGNAPALTGDQIAAISALVVALAGSYLISLFRIHRHITSTAMSRQ